MLRLQFALTVTQLATTHKALAAVETELAAAGRRSGELMPAVKAAEKAVAELEQKSQLAANESAEALKNVDLQRAQIAKLRGLVSAD